MMDYNDKYMLTHDIDWFCVIDGMYVHLASAGGLLPNGFRNKEKLRMQQYCVANTPFVFEKDEIRYNEDFLNQRFKDNPKGKESYIVTFREMAQKGFVSMDRTNLTDLFDNHYHLVCYPRKPDRQVLAKIEIPVLNSDENFMLDMSQLRLIE